jgi:hypothetical protein
MPPVEEYTGTFHIRQGSIWFLITAVLAVGFGLFSPSPEVPTPVWPIPSSNP